MLLALLELLFGANAKQKLAQSEGWMGHALGEKAIILSRTPESFMTRYSHQLFVDGRLHLIIADIQRRKHSFLSEPVWKIIPWSVRRKSPKDKLFDILAEIPGILEELDALRACKTIAQQSLMFPHLEQRCWQYDTELLVWSKTTGALTVFFIEPQIAGETLPDRSLSSEEVATAHLGAIYWSACILLYEVLRFTVRPGAL
ncbi:hypothetical protein BP6252_01844 [Coleophoma cylindrospora]|uniref:Uncharacterized protein n=1 Tax=Coleophoma cylindrospora TaxID=1849047 RepID=A0A3D8SDS2_9HELO|nr:hypothetical protein BP6252_01844 [Coleophoma cylindrospora]